MITVLFFCNCTETVAHNLVLHEKKGRDQDKVQKVDLGHLPVSLEEGPPLDPVTSSTLSTPRNSPIVQNTIQSFGTPSKNQITPEKTNAYLEEALGVFENLLKQIESVGYENKLDISNAYMIPKISEKLSKISKNKKLSEDQQQEQAGKEKERAITTLNLRPYLNKIPEVRHSVKKDIDTIMRFRNLIKVVLELSMFEKTDNNNIRTFMDRFYFDLSTFFSHMISEKIYEDGKLVTKSDYRGEFIIPVARSQTEVIEREDSITMGYGLPPTSDDESDDESDEPIEKIEISNDLSDFVRLGKYFLMASIIIHESLPQKSKNDYHRLDEAKLDYFRDVEEQYLSAIGAQLPENYKEDPGSARKKLFFDGENNTPTADLSKIGRMH